MSDNNESVAVDIVEVWSLSFDAADEEIDILKIG
jgi:hypothetical protein